VQTAFAVGRPAFVVRIGGGIGITKILRSGAKRRDGCRDGILNYARLAFGRIVQLRERSLAATIAVLAIARLSERGLHAHDAGGNGESGSPNKISKRPSIHIFISPWRPAASASTGKLACRSDGGAECGYVSDDLGVCFRGFAQPKPRGSVR
jgi:hypothetical protein